MLYDRTGFALRRQIVRGVSGSGKVGICGRLEERCCVRKPGISIYIKHIQIHALLNLPKCII